jgi:hypothetical protein
MAARSAIYLGPTENLLAERPTVGTGEPGFERKSLRAWRIVQRLLPRDPVILRLTTFARGKAPTDDWPRIAPGVQLVRGPSPAGTLDVPAVERPEAAWLAGAAIALVAIAAAVGSGWSAALVHADGLARALMAPSFGLAMLVLVGVAADRLGLVPAGGAAIGTTLAAAVAGWGAWGVGRARDRRRRRPADAPARERAVASA